jgi:hypothetical protein
MFIFAFAGLLFSSLTLSYPIIFCDSAILGAVVPHYPSPCIIAANRQGRPESWSIDDLNWCLPRKHQIMRAGPLAGSYITMQLIPNR